MKLLFDENLSRRLVELLVAEFPGSSHPDLGEMRGVTDAALWFHARQYGFAIVSKDNDFRQRAFLYGAPPKVIWLSVGNAGTQAIADLLRSSTARIGGFADVRDEGLLVLELPRMGER